MASPTVAPTQYQDIGSMFNARSAWCSTSDYAKVTTDAKIARGMQRVHEAPASK